MVCRLDERRERVRVPGVRMPRQGDANVVRGMENAPNLLYLLTKHANKPSPVRLGGWGCERKPTPLSLSLPLPLPLVAPHAVGVVLRGVTSAKKDINSDTNQATNQATDDDDDDEMQSESERTEEGVSTFHTPLVEVAVEGEDAVILSDPEPQQLTVCLCVCARTSGTKQTLPIATRASFGRTPGGHCLSRFWGWLPRGGGGAHCSGFYR